MHMRLAIVGLSCLAVLTPVACRSIQDRDDLRQEWRTMLRDGSKRSNFDLIYVFEPGIGGVEGYRVWQGEYRGVPIALYSCSYSKPWGGDLGWMSIVLAVEETAIPLRDVHLNVPVDYTGPPIARLDVREIVEHKYSPLEIDIESILRDPRHQNTWQIGQVRVEVKDQGDGRLGFKINATRKPTWAAFDLEKVLKGENLSGAKKIKPLAFKKYTPQEFAKAMIAMLKKARVTADPWWRSSPTSAEMIALDHPMWEAPAAVKALLTTAATKELVHAINFMKRRCKDSRYLRRLESIDSILLGLANHKSSEVRGAFGNLLWQELLWPKDVHALEPLLETDDTRVLTGVLGAFADRGEVPRDMQRVRELGKSKDSFVRSRVERLLELNESKKHR